MRQSTRNVPPAGQPPSHVREHVLAEIMEHLRGRSTSFLLDYLSVFEPDEDPYDDGPRGRPVPAPINGTTGQEMWALAS